MSKFNRKGYGTLLGRTESGELKPFPVKRGAKVRGIQNHRMKKAKKERDAAFRKYKAELKARKKGIPLADRSKVNISKLPERFL